MFIIVLQTSPTKALLVKEKLNVKAVWMIGEGEPRKAGEDREGTCHFLEGRKTGASHKHSFIFRLAILTVMCFVRQVLNTD